MSNEDIGNNKSQHNTTSVPAADEYQSKHEYYTNEILQEVCQQFQWIFTGDETHNVNWSVRNQATNDTLQTLVNSSIKPIWAISDAASSHWANIKQILKKLSWRKMQ